MDLISLGVDPSRCCMVDGSEIRSNSQSHPILRVIQFLQDGWSSFLLATCLIIPLLTYRPLLAHWASHVHHNLSFLLPCLHFYNMIGALSCMQALFRSFMSLEPMGAFFSLFFYHHITILHHISLVVFFIFFCVIFATCSISSFLHLEWWSSLVHYMEDSHIISIINPTGVDPKILSLRRSSH